MATPFALWIVVSLNWTRIPDSLQHGSGGTHVRDVDTPRGAIDLARPRGAAGHRAEDVAIAAGGTRAQAEIQRMVLEKVVASMRAGAMLSMGKPTAAIVRHYRSTVRANERRLLGAKTRARWAAADLLAELRSLDCRRPLGHAGGKR